MNSSGSKIKRVLLVDFGMATRYIDEQTGDHLEITQQREFKGNILFASLNALNFDLTTRKDDLISLCYLFLTMLNGGDFPLIDQLKNDYTQGKDKS